jgi:hypothetical protein
MNIKQRKACVVAGAFGLIGAVLMFILLPAQLISGSRFLAPGIVFLIVVIKTYGKAVRQ